MKKRLQGLLIGILIGVLFSGAMVYASTGVKKIDANYSNIKLVINGKEVTPKDVTGKVVEPFIYDGTTYLPVRAVSEALGYNVSWDGNTRTVSVGNSSSSGNVLSPYQSNMYGVLDSFKMMGKTYNNGFVFTHQYAPGDGAFDGYALFNLDGKYSSLEFDLGHVDETGMRDYSYKIYLDGTYSQTIDVTSEMPVTHIRIPLNYALQMKIETYLPSVYNPSQYGFTNIVLNR